jgi:Peptidase family M50
VKATLRFLCRTFSLILVVIGFFIGVVAGCAIVALAVICLQERGLQPDDRQLLMASVGWLAGACLFVWVSWRWATAAGESGDYLRYRKSLQKPNGQGDRTWLVFLFLVLTPAVWSGLSGPPILKLPALAGWMILVFLGLHLQIFLHELGHFTAAWLMRFRLRKMQVGVGRLLWSCSFANGMRFEWRAWSLGGMMVATDPATRNFRLRHFIHVAAGPVSDIVILWAGYNLFVSDVFGPAIRNSPGGFVAGFVLLCTVFSVLGNVIPRKGWLDDRRVRTDGYWLWLLLTASDKRLASLAGQMRWCDALETGAFGELPPWFIPAALPVASTDPGASLDTFRRQHRRLSSNLLPRGRP